MHVQEIGLISSLPLLLIGKDFVREHNIVEPKFAFSELEHCSLDNTELK